MEEVKKLKSELIEKQKQLIRAKLKQAILDYREGKEQQEENQLTDTEIYDLLDMLEEAGLEEKKDFYFDEYEDFGARSPLIEFRVGNSFLSLGYLHSRPEFSTIEEVEDFYKDMENKPDKLNFPPLDLKILGIDIEHEENASEQSNGEQETTATSNTKKMDRYTKILLEKIRILAEEEEIPEDLFTESELGLLSKALQGKTDCFLTFHEIIPEHYEPDYYFINYEGYQTNIFQIGNKVYTICNGKLEVTPLEEYQRKRREYLETRMPDFYTLDDEEQEVEEDAQVPVYPLPLIATTFEEIEDAIIDCKSKDPTEEKEKYSFEEFIKNSVPRTVREKRPCIICSDGTEYSVQASSMHQCEPQEDGREAYQTFEIKIVSGTLDDELREYAVAGEEDICAFVPRKLIEEIITVHGGLDAERMKERLQEQKAVYEPRDEEFEKWVKEQSLGNEYIENMLRFATRRQEVRGKNEQAKKLEEEYQQQLPEEEQSKSEE